MKDRAIVFVFTGESNSGGIGLNAEATPADLAPRSCLQVLNLTGSTFRFEPLQAGVNNLREHAGLEEYCDTCHGFEIALANSVEAGLFSDYTACFLIKTGQGGSRIADWEAEAGSGYWARFLERIAAAREQLPADRQWVVWLSLGINDAIAGTPIGEWKRKVAAHLARLRVELPGTIIVMTQFQSMTGEPSLVPINQALAGLAAEEAGTFVVDTGGAPLRDLWHWSYAGLKQVGSLLAAASRMGLRSRQEEV